MIDQYQIDDYNVTIERDEVMGRPWEESDCHGIIEHYRHDHAKNPGQRALPNGYFYDIQATQKIAKRNGWGVANPPPGATRAQIASLAVEADFKRMRGWLNDEWQYVGFLIERDGVIVESCCGFESDDCEYINTVIEEFIEIDRASRAKEDEESKIICANAQKGARHENT